MDLYVLHLSKKKKKKKDGERGTRIYQKPKFKASRDAQLENLHSAAYEIESWRIPTPLF